MDKFLIVSSMLLLIGLVAVVILALKFLNGRLAQQHKFLTDMVSNNPVIQRAFLDKRYIEQHFYLLLVVLFIEEHKHSGYTEPSDLKVNALEDLVKAWVFSKTDNPSANNINLSKDLAKETVPLIIDVLRTNKYQVTVDHTVAFDGTNGAVVCLSNSDFMKDFDKQLTLFRHDAKVFYK